MSARSVLILLLVVQSAFVASLASQFEEYPSNPHLLSVLSSSRKSILRLSKPLVRDDGRVYSCSERKLLAFEGNGSIAWTVNLKYTCNAGIAPVHGGSRKIYLVAENKVMRINPLNIGNSESAVEVFFDPDLGEEPGEIVGLSVSTLSSSMFINVKNKGLLAYRLQGEMLWSIGPVLYRSGYRQGCRKNYKDCYFASTPVIDQCEASIYISNTEGELYAMSVRSPHFKWIQDFSALDKSFVITPGNNGRVYVTVPVRALVLALDVSTGTVLWQSSIGPLSTTDCAPVVDSNGWISIGSLDGFLYSISPTGVPKKFPKAAAPDSVVQVSPFLDCSGYAVYISRAEMEGKVSHTIGEYTYISAMKPRNAAFTLLVPATGTIYWSKSYPASSQLLSILSESDLQHFVLDESILLAFITASNTGNPLPCRSTRQKVAISCSQAEPPHVSIYTGNDRTILLFLLFETVTLMVLVIVVRFCCIFWRKKKLQNQDLGKFLEKRRFLQLQNKTFDRTITELEQNAAKQAVPNEMLERLGDLVKQKEGIERKLSTTYSLGRDKTESQSKSLLPLYDGKTKSYSVQGAKRESVTLFHTLSDTCSADSSSEEEAESTFFQYIESAAKANGKQPIEVGSSSDNETEEEYKGASSGLASSSESFENPMFMGPAFYESDEGEARETMHHGNRSIRRTLSSTN